MQSSKVIKTGFCRLGHKGVWMPSSDEMIEELGMDAETLLKIDFEISVIQDKIVIEGRIPSREQRPSAAPTPRKAGTNQGADTSV